MTVRERPVFYDRYPPSPTAPGRSLAVGDSRGREVWQQSALPSDVPKRYKAAMKQVVGIPFTGTLAPDAEVEIIDELLAASRVPFDEPDQQILLTDLLKPVLEKLKILIGSRVKIYLQSIAARLLDRTTKLAWSATSNNCQDFCDALIDRQLFEPLINGPQQPAPDDKPLYIMSFVCPPQPGYLQRRIASKYDVPSGLTEEYLLGLHYGRHYEDDIIDTLSGYWHDWGAFGGPLYEYQHLFPWDCTEAYNRYPARCGSDCNLAKHVWAFPFDAWSIISLHLTRDRHMYPPAAADTRVTPQQSWLRDRLTVLTANAILTRTAAAMASTPGFAAATAWLHQPNSALRKTCPGLERVKLGGIHRAQPFSHYFMWGTCRHYFVADWALLARPSQVASYERLREERAQLLDVPAVRGGARRSRRVPPASRFVTGFAGFGGPRVGVVVTVMGQNDSWAPGDASFTAADHAPDLGGSGPACAVRCGANCGTDCGSTSCAAGADASACGSSGGGCGGGGCGGGD